MDTKVKIEKYKLSSNKYAPLFTEVTTLVKDYPSFETKDCRVVCDQTEKETSLCMIKLNAAGAVEKTPADVLEHVMSEQMIKCVTNVSLVFTEKPSDNELITGYRSSANSMMVKIDTLERVPNDIGGYDLVIDISDESQYTRTYAPGVDPSSGCATVTVMDAFYSDRFYISAIQINGVMTKWLAEDQIGILLKWRDRLIKEWDEFYKVNTEKQDQYGQWIPQEHSPNYIFAKVAPKAQTFAVTPMPIWTDFTVGIQMGFPIPQKTLISGDPTLDIEGITYVTAPKEIPMTMDGTIEIHFGETASSNPPSYSNNFRWELIEALKKNEVALIRVDEIYHENYRELGLETARFYVFTFSDIQIIQGTIPFTTVFNESLDEKRVFSRITREYKVTDAKVRHYNQINVIKRVDAELRIGEFIYKIYVGNGENSSVSVKNETQEITVNNTCGCK